MPTGSTGMAGKRVLVTGGTRGIGRVTALAFAEAGARVATCGRKPGPEAESLDRALRDHGPGHLVTHADVTDEAEVARLAAECRTALGGLDVVVNNVGVDGAGPLERIGPAEWQRALDHNITSAYLVTRDAVALMDGGGAVVNVASAAALRGRPASAHYCASKAALLGLTRGLCKELGPRGIRVNSVAPGLVDTGDGDGPPGHVVDRIISATPLGRLCRPDDVAAAVLFLAADQAGFISGVTLNVDGGM